MELHRASGRHGLGLALAATTMLLWGALPLALEIVLGGLDAATTVWVRFLFAAVVLGGVLASRGRLRGLARLGPTGWLQLGVATLFLALNYFAYVVGLDLTNAASAQVLLQLAPLLLALGGIVVFREHFSRLQWLGFAVLVVGLGVFFLDQVRSRLFQKQLLRRLSSQQIMVGIYTGCALGFLPFARPAALTSLDAVQLAALAFCALNTVVAYGAFSEALAHWEATRVSSVLALTPLATLGFVALGNRLAPGWVESEPVSATGLVGAAVVVAGSLLAALGGTPQTAAGAD
jgi:drug/metabolite transporter (DMT)-like permease